MMTREQYLWGKLAEECGELAQEAIKCQQFGSYHVFGNANGVSNVERLNGEFNDILGVIDMLNRQLGQALVKPDDDLRVAKATKVEKWYGIAKEMGTVA
jgi:NTP pyrophosphatase (non-canonical NTP hydrolase)